MDRKRKAAAEISDARKQIKADAARLRDEEERIRRARAALAASADANAFKTVLRSFSLQDLGSDHVRAGGVAEKKRRIEVLDRVFKHGAQPTLQQATDWEWFKTAWDAYGVRVHKNDWAHRFREAVLDVLRKLSDGNARAVLEFMEAETRGTLVDEPVLRC
ncbi:MAG: hypothetical protein GY725_27130 [bacterium]|nr:hypothetical protein [bacterium]